MNNYLVIFFYFILNFWAPSAYGLKVFSGVNEANEGAIELFHGQA